MVNLCFIKFSMWQKLGKESVRDDLEAWDLQGKEHLIKFNHINENRDLII